MSEAHPAQDIVYGRRPVLAVLEEGRPLRRLFLVRGGHGDVIDEIIRRARAGGIPFDLLDRAALDRTAAGGNHQGVIAMMAARDYADYDKVLAAAGPDAFLLFLDNLQDPHNLGAILRTAHALGVDAAVLPRRVRPQTREARQNVLLLRHLDLHFAFPRAGALGEDVEDELGPVHHRKLGDRGQISEL